MAEVLKRIFVGRPLATTQMEHQRISKTIALPVFSSDALSSTAYATEEILFVTAVGASSLALGLSKLVPIAVVVAILLTIVIISYRQVIFAYPSGGGSYVVSRENLGEYPSLVAGASLMVDYILTVAVSISAGVAAIVSIPAFEALATHRVELGLALIVLITVANLRGVRESGRLFAIPTYVYIVVLAALVVVGLVGSWLGDVSPVPFDQKLAEGVKAMGGDLSLFLLLKGFSSGAVALTGVEAISNGVPMFRRPEAKNAAATMVWMGVILGTLFFGVSLLARELRPYPSHDRTVIAQLGLAVFGDGPLFLLLQFATAAILTLAANTAYNGFPGLSSIVAKDGYLPRQLANRGDRLVYSNGVIFLAIAAAVLLVAFGGITNALDPPLCGRRVHRVHAVAGRDGAPPSHAPRWSVEAQHRAQRRGRHRHLRGPDDRLDHEVHERRVAPRRRDPHDRVGVQGDQAPLHACRRRVACRARIRATAPAAHRDRDG